MSLLAQTGSVRLGHLAALLLAGLLLWLMVRLGLSGWRQGLSFGLRLGTLMGASGMLGLLSVSTAELSLVVAWLLSQILQMGLAGAVTGSGLAGLRPRTLFLRVIALVLCLAVATIVIQSVGG